MLRTIVFVLPIGVSTVVMAERSSRAFSGNPPRDNPSATDGLPNRPASGCGEDPDAPRSEFRRDQNSRARANLPSAKPGLQKGLWGRFRSGALSGEYARAGRAKADGSSLRSEARWESGPM